MSKENAPIMMAEGYWANSFFSIARYCGGVKAFGYEYNIVNKEGVTIFELSNPKSKHYVGDGNKKAIEPGEPADLVRTDWIPVYRVLGRDKFIEYLDAHEPADLKEAMKEIKKIMRNRRADEL